MINHIYRCLIPIVLLCSTLSLSGQLFVEGGYTSSLSFNYQKDDSYPEFSNETAQFERIPSYLGNDYAYKHFKIGIGYKWQKSKFEHSFSVNYNRKGAGGDFSVDIFLDEYSSELIGDILIGHIQFGGYTREDTDYMFGIWHDNIGVRYGMKLLEYKGFKISPNIQVDYSFNPRDRIISINNIPVPITTGGSYRGTLIEPDVRKYLVNIGIELEKSINNQIAIYMSGLQSLNSYTKVGAVFSNSAYISTFEIGVRFYQ